MATVQVGGGARGVTAAPPEVVTVHVWTVPRRYVPAAVLRMGLDRRVRRTPGVRFAKLLGTSDGRTFAVRDATLTRWALLVAWRHARDAAHFDEAAVPRAWDAMATSTLRLRLRPLASRGRWSGQLPFGEPVDVPWDGAVASLTRARVRPGAALAFHRAVPAVSRALREAPGLRLALGVGDAPVGLLGTFSVWDSPADLRAFAFRGDAHPAVVRASRAQGWFAEELFARFAVVGADGLDDAGAGAWT